MKSYFFNAEPTNDLANHPTGYDREYDADSHAEFFAPFFTKAGVMAGADAEACKVVVVDGNTLGIMPGTAYVKGRMVSFDGTETVVAEQDCKIVARMNKTADVRGFQLLCVQELVQTDDIYDLELAQVALTPVLGGYEATITDKRAFMAFTGQPPYYPPDSDNLPYVLWLYTLGFPMTAEQRAAVMENPGLMNIYNASVGALTPATVSFTAAQWSNGKLIIPKATHKRQTGKFGYTLRHLAGGRLVGNTWGVMGTNVSYDMATGNIVLESPDAYSGQIEFFA